MHPGDLATLAAVAVLVALLAASVWRSRRSRKAPEHKPAAAGGPAPDRAALITIGTVAADGARSAMG